MKQKFWTSDKIVSFSAIMISVLSLFMFIKQTNIIEEQSHLSVMPYLMMETSYNSAESIFKLDLINHGVGPAIIEGKSINYKGEISEQEFNLFLRERFPQMDSISVLNNSTVHIGLALPAGGTRNILTIGGDEKSYRDFLQIFDNMQQDYFNYEIRYKSIYEDRWKITSEEQIPEALDE